ncbi:MAG: hypothetical protein FWG98_07295 [Candidatus Cloacimonetes bacterium]|nr:hypothetical protein [Candidatus Cloacimonadota bacterium]
MTSSLSFVLIVGLILLPALKPLPEGTSENIAIILSKRIPAYTTLFLSLSAMGCLEQLMFHRKSSNF